MPKSLFLVRGHEIDGENQDVFAVGDSRTEAALLWNQWCLANGLPRDDNDDEDPNTTYDPENVRCIVKDVTGTEYDNKPSYYVDWDAIP